MNLHRIPRRTFFRGVTLGRAIYLAPLLRDLQAAEKGSKPARVLFSFRARRDLMKFSPRASNDLVANQARRSLSQWHRNGRQPQTLAVAGQDDPQRSLRADRPR